MQKVYHPQNSYPPRPTGIKRVGWKTRVKEFRPAPEDAGKSRGEHYT